LSERREDRSLRLLDRTMAVAALAILLTLIVRQGLRLGAALDPFLALGNAVAVLVFAAAQASKLVVVPDPVAYFRAHRLDFALLFVLVIQLASYAGLRGTAEFRWLERQGADNPLWPLLAASVQAYMVAIVALRSPVVHGLLVSLRLRPAQILVVSFALLIAAGTALLSMPGAAADGRAWSPLDAMFTATSAVCVTGLVVSDMGSQFSSLGAVVLLLLIQAGGLGMLTVTGSFALFGGEGFERCEADALTKAMQVESVQEFGSVLRRIVTATLLFEGLGAVALFAAWAGTIPDVLQRTGWAVFHAVSAFCNAGFALFPTNASLTGAAGTPATLATIGALIVAGGIGFGVLDELGRRFLSRALRRPAPPLSSHARWTLGATALLLVLGTALFWAAERDGTLRSFPAGESWMHAAFQSVTLRTAGFNSVDLAALGAPALALCVVWMLVGGAPGGTAGGMKVTIAASAFRPSASDTAVRRRALLLAAMFLVQYVVVTGALALAQGTLDGRLVFEAASALGTVGLSLGTTPELGTAGKWIICIAMFAGRVGPFVLAASLLPRLERAAALRRPAGSILLG
jgi:trk system potassium uptake protein TrkH